MPRMAEHPQARVPSCGRARSCRGLLPGRRASSCTARAGAHGTSRRVRSAACRAESGTTNDGSSAALLIFASCWAKSPLSPLSPPQRS